MTFYFQTYNNRTIDFLFESCDKIPLTFEMNDNLH